MKNFIKNLEKQMSYFMTILLISSTFLLVSCDDDDDNPGEPTPAFTVSGVTGAIGGLSTLNTAISVAGLETALAGDGPFTLFAPTNTAFGELDPTTLNNILANPDLLSQLLQYHVVSGERTSRDLATASVPTLMGQSIDVNVSNGVTINGSAQVVSADILATNGVVHMINKVLIPEDFQAESITQIAIGNSAFSTLVSILTKPELSDLLAAASDPTQNLTVFAPTNDAFDALLTALGKNSIDEIPTTILREIVSYHILGSTVMSNQLTDGAMVETLLTGESVTVDLSSGVMINNSSVVIPDVEAVNGVVHAIDNVLLPSYVAQAVGTISEVVMFNEDYSIL